MNPLKALFEEQGQSVWLDFLARGFIARGELKRLVDEDGLRGVTSNPAIFEKAIGESDDYDEALKAAQHRPDEPVMELYEGLAIEDIRDAADVLRPIYEASRGGDGFVSLEVSPYLALDTAATMAEARRLWREVKRDNLMVKVPATTAGLPAIRDLTAEGININVTLLFSQGVYEEVAQAYIEGLERLAAKGGDIGRIASVASFFVSRIDTAADKELDRRIGELNDPGEKAALAGLKGKVAIANAKLAHQRYKRIYAGERWQALRAKGAREQRLLWASTGTKNKAYSDVLYVEELIGPNTVNTMPPATMDAFRDHGRVRPTMEAGLEEARSILARLERAGISLDAITEKLVDEGVQLFADAFDKLLAAVASKRVAVLGPQLNAARLSLGAALDRDARQILAKWRSSGAVRRLWHKDAKLWTGGDEARWLGWLDIADREMAQVKQYRSLADDVRREGFSDALLLGMGGSSLGPEVLGQVLGPGAGFPRLHILDSTDPVAVKMVEQAVDLARTLFIVSSKSGSTLEPNIFKDYFFDRVRETIGAERAGARFIAVTDPGSSLERVAKAEGFRAIFYGDPNIGGRYSVLSAFGLVPAATSGIDIARLLAEAQMMTRSCGPDVPPDDNSGVRLGVAMGMAARQGRDKVTIVTSRRLVDFGAWAEQLIAESTGKNGKGLIPIDAEPLGSPEVYGEDRLFIQLRLKGDVDPDQDAALAAIERADHPVIRIDVAAPEAIAQEFCRWEFATAVAGAVIGINPFDQPDVEASKVKTRELTSAYERTGELPRERPVFAGDGVELYTDARNADNLRQASATDSLEAWLKAHLDRTGKGDYVAFLAYVSRSPELIEALQRTRMVVRDKRRVATCLGFGPRFLHSTGQVYKGGPNTGVFLQVTADHPIDLPIPGHRFTFGVAEAAQARGDFDVLAERGRRALRVHLKGSDLAAGLGRLHEAVQAAVSSNARSR